MLFFTNREIDVSKNDEAAFTNRFTIMDESLAAADVAGVYKAGGGATWTLANVSPQADDNDLIPRLVAVFGAGRPVLVYLHGNSNPPAKSFYRCKRLEDIYGISVIGFSWTSEGFLPDGSNAVALASDGDAEDSLKQVKSGNLGLGAIKSKIQRYHQAKINAQQSTMAVARFLRLVAVARMFAGVQQPYSIAGHSLGCHLLQKTLPLDGTHAAVATADNVILLAPCTRAEQHRGWVEKLSPKDRVYIVFNNLDPVLAAADIADSGEIKLGLNPGLDIIRSPRFRYIDMQSNVSSSKMHACFSADNPDTPRKADLKLFTALFRSEDDFPVNGNPKSVYLAGCNGDLSICSMSFHS
ncbi:hypothetical protein WKW79_11975 [Variovorax robiniae]|uniref:Alpha/beta hydrolase n=1 Tax=Variovorax robiniae TaxID=1836199 RepID=A0ABU8X8D7_9BURK